MFLAAYVLALSAGQALRLSPDLLAKMLAGVAVVPIVAAGTQRTDISPRLWPHRAQQLPRSLIVRSSKAALSIRWGLLLGSGVLTHLESPAFYALVLLTTAAALMESVPIVIVVAGISYGAGRVLVPWWLWMTSTPSRPSPFVRATHVARRAQWSTVLIAGLAAYATWMSAR